MLQLAVVWLTFVVYVGLGKVMKVQIPGFDIPDYSEDILMLHLKMDKIMDALRIEKIDYVPKANPNKEYIQPSKPSETTYNTNTNSYHEPKPAATTTNPMYGSSMGTNSYAPVIDIDSHLKMHQNAATLQEGHAIESGHEKEAFIKTDDEQDKELNYGIVHQGGSAAGHNQEYATEGYVNAEGFNGAKYDIVDEKVEQNGRKFDRKSRSTRKSNITLATDIQKDITNSKGIENHSGVYEGNEFDLNYNVDQQNAEFKDYEQQREHESLQNEKVRANNGIGNEYQVNGNDYIKYGDNSNDSKYRKYEIGQRIKEPVTAYDKFNDKDRVLPAPNYYHGDGIDRLNQREYSDKDDMYKDYGNNVKGNSYNEAEYGHESGIGYNQRDKGSEYINQGKLAKVQASGANKQAQYKGNYDTSDAYEKGSDKQAFNAYFFQSGSNIDPSSQNGLSLEEVDEVVYSRTEQKGKRDIDYYDGHYQDTELKKYGDKGNYKQIYDDQELYANKQNENEIQSRAYANSNQYQTKVKEQAYKPNNNYQNVKYR